MWVSLICSRDGSWNRIPTHGAVRAASCTLQYLNEPDSSRLPGSVQEQHEAVARCDPNVSTAVIADFRNKSIQADTGVTILLVFYTPSHGCLGGSATPLGWPFGRGVCVSGQEGSTEDAASPLDFVCVKADCSDARGCWWSVKPNVSFKSGKLRSWRERRQGLYAEAVRRAC